MARHISIVVGGVKEKAVAVGFFQLSEAPEEPRGNRFQVLLLDPVPFVPIVLGVEGLNVDRADLLDGGLAVPIRECPFGAGVNHPVEYRIEEVFSNGGTFFMFPFGYHRIDE